MSKTEMPAAEAQSYELAFHVLPTVAEGEVSGVFQTIKDIITKAGGEITSEEEPARFDLAYDIEKHIEGRNRKFSTAYFGWARFVIDPAEVAEIDSQVETNTSILRHLLVKLTKTEEANPFFFHEALAEEKQSEIIDVSDEAEKEPEKKEEETANEDEESTDAAEDKDESEAKTN